MTSLPDQLIELRNYLLVPGAAGAFADHFEQHFLASQEELGMDIVGQFTVAGDDARFVWVRRFRRPADRAAALEAFYTGPVWKAFGPRANELLLDHTDVHLLAPDPSAPAFAADHRPHASLPSSGPASPPQDAPRAPGSTVVGAFYDLGESGTLPAETATAMTSAAADAGTDVVELGRLVTARVPNEFPRLPVHEDGAVAVWLLSDRAGGQAATAVARAVGGDRLRLRQTIRLVPTGRSSLR